MDIGIDYPAPCFLRREIAVDSAGRPAVWSGSMMTVDSTLPSELA